MKPKNKQAVVPGVVLRRNEVDDLAGSDAASPEFRKRMAEGARKQKELDELQEIARVATRSALESYEPIPAEWSKNLTLGTLFDGDDRVFELYVAAERPKDAIVLASARVNRITRSVAVKVTNLRQRQS